MPVRPAIDHQPRPSPWKLFRASRPGADEAWSSSELHAGGREALFRAYRSVSTGPWSVAWFPSFHCGVEVQAAVAAGWEVDFFPMDVDLRVDRQETRERISERPGPVTLIHYFGHPTSDVDFMAGLCRRIAVPLIEDACHGPLSEAVGGSYTPQGAAVAFSLQKVLGLPDGGILRLRLDRAPGVSRRSDFGGPRPRRRSVGPVLAYARRFVALGGSPRIGRSSGDADRGLEDPLEPDAGYGRRISHLSERLAGRVDPGRVAERRRANWLILRERLTGVAGFRPVYGELAAGAVPLSLAVRVARRDELVRRLLCSRIDSYVFGRWPHPEFPASVFPRTRRLRREVVGLPVHHELTLPDLDRMTRVLSALLPEHDLGASGDGPRSEWGDATPCAE